MQMADSQIEQCPEDTRSLDEVFLVVLGTLPDLRIVVDKDVCDQIIALGCETP